MRVVIQNISSNVLSTDIGSIEPFSTRTADMGPMAAYGLAASLKHLVDNGMCSITIADDPTRLDEIEPASVLEARNISIAQANGLVFTSQDITLWVDGTNGSDSNMGSEALPFKTINKAIDMVPLFIKHKVTIKIKAGSYAETLQITRAIAPNSTLSLEGEFTTSQLTSGPSTGTVASVVGRVVTVTGATWVENELSGTFLKVTSGSFAGLYIPIVSNTADTITFPAIVSSSVVVNQTFELVDTATILLGGTDTLKECVHINGIDRSNTTFGLMFSGIDFRRSIRATFSQYSIKACKISNGSTNTATISNFGGYVKIDQCHLSCSRYYLLFCNGSVSVIVNDTIFMHTAAVSASECIRATAGCELFIYTCYMKGFLSTAFNVTKTSVTTQKVTYENCKSAIITAGSSGTISMTDDVITGCSSHAIILRGPSDSLYMLRTSISDTTGSAIRVEAPHVSIRLDGTCNLNTSSAFAVDLSQSYGCTIADISTTCLMSANASGDLTFNGSTANTLDELRGDGDKTLQDATKFCVFKAQ